MMKRSTILITATLLGLLAPALLARADIFEWEYINPANPAQGKQPSTTLAPDGAGANAVQGTDLSNRNLTMAYLIDANVSTYLVYDQYGFVISYVASNLTAVTLSQADLANAYFGGAGGYMNEEFTYFPGADLTDANLSQANLTNAWFDSGILTDANLSGAEARGAIFWFATLTGANFTDAEVRGADFSSSGVTAAQLYSTASYQAHDLTGVRLAGNNLAGVDLAAQNVTNADFTSATLTNANFSQANLANVKFTSDGVYGVVDLSGANLSGANLTNAYFAGFDTCGEFGCGTSPGANFAGQNLTNADLRDAALTNADLSRANLADANFAGYVNCGEEGCAHVFGANLTNANLSAADARAADFYAAPLAGANLSNMIGPDGHIAGLDLTTNASLVVRDYENYAGVGIPIVVDEHLAMDATGTLRLVFDADPWDSTISFTPGIPVALGGTLELAFAPDVNVASQSGRTIDLFDWTGVAPTGAFTVESPYTWDLSRLYTTGEVTLMALSTLAGDYSGNGTVGPEDYSLWKANFGSTTLLAADGNGDGIVNAADYTVWRNNLGATLPGSGSAGASPYHAAAPEPASVFLVAFGAVLVGLRWNRRWQSRGLNSSCDPAAADRW